MTLSFPTLDLIALIIFFAFIVSFELITEQPKIRARGITEAIHQARRKWMLEMAAREIRIFDAQLIGWLSNGNAFFASTSAIAIGGLAALLSSTEKIEQILAKLPYASSDTHQLIELKVLLLMVIMIYAFFKFAWAFRLSHYTVILMGGTPAWDSPNPQERDRQAIRAADLLSIVGEHANRGLRSFYYAIAAMAWFFHPFALILATAVVIAILLRREFLSGSRKLILASINLPKN